MLSLNNLLPLTGYVRGGCSPIGMKKQFPTIFADSVLQKDFILVSAGIRGQQLKLNPQELIKFLHAECAEILL